MLILAILSCDLEFWFLCMMCGITLADNVCLDYVGEAYISLIFFSGQLRCCCRYSVSLDHDEVGLAMALLINLIDCTL